MNDNDIYHIQQQPPPAITDTKSRLDELPTAVLKSAAVETLISQNDQLAYQLKITLRRTAGLESRLEDLEHQFVETQRIRRQAEERLKGIDDVENHLRDRALKAEQELLEKQKLNNELKTQLTKLDKFKRRVMRWIKPHLELYQQARPALRARDAQIGDLRARVEELSRYIQKQEQIRQMDIARLTEAYEARLKKSST